MNFDQTLEYIEDQITDTERGEYDYEEDGLDNDPSSDHYCPVADMGECLCCEQCVFKSLR